MEAVTAADGVAVAVVAVPGLVEGAVGGLVGVVDIRGGVMEELRAAGVTGLAVEAQSYMTRFCCRLTR
jgi:hypothetical protein